MPIVLNGSGTVTGISVGGLPDGIIQSADLASGVGGKILQIVNTQTGAMSTGTTIIPNDDTIPQITEGFEVMTRTITPTNTSNILLINVVCHLSASVNSMPTTALFVGSTADALASTFSHAFGAGAYPKVHNFTHKMTAGSTSELTFRVRTGMNNSGTVTFNGRDGSRMRGGSAASSITIMEIAA
tara:strand:- start:1411 stop:1965 length:555 start_codon:yes stop_codon:yes gene_type:complete